MIVSTDDGPRRVERKWLGPKGMRLPWTWPGWANAVAGGEFSLLAWLIWETAPGYLVLALLFPAGGITYLTIYAIRHWGLISPTQNVWHWIYGLWAETRAPRPERGGATTYELAVPTGSVFDTSTED